MYPDWNMLQDDMLYHVIVEYPAIDSSVDTMDSCMHSSDVRFVLLISVYEVVFLLVEQRTV